MTAVTALHEHRIPAPLDLDDDDAFGADDENPASMPYVFSPDAIREEMSRNMPESAVEVEGWGDGYSTASTGGFFTAQNTSVSTIDIGPNGTHTHGFGSQGRSPSPESASLSSHFSQVDLTSPSDEQPTQELPSLSDVYTKTKGTENGNGNVDHSFTTVVRESASLKPPALDLAPTSTPPTPPPHDYTENDARTPTSAPVQQSPSLHDISEPSPSFHSPATSTLSTSPVVAAGAAAAASSSLPAIATTAAQSSSGNLLTEKPLGHRAHRSMGPSMFEKVRSRTRPTFLPPKPREEDDKHLAVWQQMMKQSRMAAEKRRKALQERRLAREKAIEETLHIWEREILPDWRVVHKNPQLRKLWMERDTDEAACAYVGKGDHYHICLSRAKRALSSGVFPQATLDLIDQDMESTLPALHIFHKETGPLYGELKDMLCAWVVARSDEGLGYTIGAAKIAAMLLINMPNQQGFIVMRNLLERHLLRSFFGGERSQDEVEAYYRIFDTMLADGMPKIYFNFKQHQISPGAYLPDWLLPLFLDHLPFEACARIWDVLLLEGDSFLYRASLGILAVLEPRLFFPERKELLELLKGDNKAAIEVAKREGQALNGGKYEIYGVDEETLWDRIDGMDDWWKETTWTRLIQRELPDL
ncbi:hypothetical protein NLJ89_g4125 [Agrocybe chaxingu]|uniref:Rab-GAP TBC domain-containing protein n=1 Tax=Agrocybe chaxingu TaxID=84603 RepID=A0A9W8K4I9_9AGAR|nr:hypothetical protein NLJ89_g4125 [Agrocybe chaxingu]